MSDDVPSRSTYEGARRIDALCDQFESDWLAGRPSPIESFLEKVALHERRGLLTELLAIEVELAERDRRALDLSDYLMRFREFADVVLKAVVQPSSATEESGNPSSTDVPPSIGSYSGAASGASRATHGARFQALRQHARGGLGRIWLAVDAEFQREVALKEMLPDQATMPEQRQRFVLEAEVTGRLEHPGIVPVYGLGMAGDGRPFYAMRFIQGQSLEAAIRQFHRPDCGDPPYSPRRSLEFCKLLNRFIAVCNAIDFAHSRGVVHRDIKPANIMLGEYGETLVVDWGMAKVLTRKPDESRASADPSATDSAGEFSGTQENSIFGTPQYMSPEQAAGQIGQLGPASDVYSLGATLYELLTGKKPFANDSLSGILENVRQGKFAPPRKRNTAIPKPLDAICLTAMAREAGKRYVSARQLADEVEHWLADEPVRAFPDSLSARLWRMARRHRGWVQAGGTAIALIALVATLASWLVNEARKRERDQRQIAVLRERDARAAESRAEAARVAAEASERQSRAATEFLVNIFDSGEPLFGLRGSGFRRSEDQEKTLTAREILDRGRQRMDEELATQPLLLATLQDSLGMAYLGLGEFDLAETLLAKARETRQKQLDANHPDLLASQLNWGIWRQIEGDLDEAEKRFREVLGAQEQSPTVEPLTLARTNLHLGWVLGEKWRHTEAEPLLRKSLAIRREKLGDKHRDVMFVRALLAMYRLSSSTGELNLADLTGILQDAPLEIAPLLITGVLRFNQIEDHRRRREYDAAIEVYKPLIADARQALGDNHPIVIAMGIGIAELHQQSGDYAASATLMRQSLARAMRSFGNNPRLAEVHFRFGQVLRARGEDDEAEWHLKEAIRVGKKVERLPWTHRAAQELANWKFSLGKIDEAMQYAPLTGGPDIVFLLETGDVDSVVRFAQSQLDEHWPKRATWPHSETAVNFSTLLARALRLKKEYGKARQVEDDCAKFLQGVVPELEAAPAAASVGMMRSYGSVLANANDLRSAEILYRLAIQRARAVIPPRHPMLAVELTEIAIFLRDHGHPADAMSLLDESLQICQERLGSKSWRTISTQIEVALTKAKLGELEGAKKIARDAYNTQLQQTGADDFRTLRAARSLAQLLDVEQEGDEAEQLLRHSLTVFEKTLPVTHSDIFATTVELGELLTRRGDARGASSHFERCLDNAKAAWTGNSWLAAEITSRWGSALSEFEQSARADSLLWTSLETLNEAWGPNHTRTRQAFARAWKHFESRNNASELNRLRAAFPAAAPPL